MQPAVPIPSVGAAQVNKVAIENRAVHLVKIHPFFHNRLRGVRVEKPRAAIAGLHARAEKVGQPRLVMFLMILERFDGGRRPAALIFGQRHKHPAHARRFFPGAVINVLALDDFLLRARQRPVRLTVAHASLARPRQKIPVRHVQINSPRAAPLVKTGDDLPLFPLRIQQTDMARMIRRGAEVARIRAVIFQNAAAGLLEKLPEFAEIIFAPDAAEARRIAETRAAGFAGLVD